MSRVAADIQQLAMPDQDPPNPKADRKPCEKCGRPTFVCAWCSKRVHSAGLSTPVMLVDETAANAADSEYAICGTCYPEVMDRCARAAENG